MAYSSDPYAAYSRANETKNHAEQIFMLYCGAISFVQQAKEAHKENDHNKRYQLVERTIQIIRGLRASLDYEANKEVATALNQFYEDIDFLLIAAQGKDDKNEIFDRIIGNLKAIKETWEQINPTISSVLEPDKYTKPEDTPSDTETGSDIATSNYQMDENYRSSDFSA